MLLLVTLQQQTQTWRLQLAKIQTRQQRLLPLLEMQQNLTLPLLAAAAAAAVRLQQGALPCTSTLSVPAAPVWQRVCRSH
jgi:hypothetical protein